MVCSHVGSNRQRSETREKTKERNKRSEEKGKGTKDSRRLKKNRQFTGKEK